MLILSNGFPTNLPTSGNVSQGGPANFARSFINHLLSSGAEHKTVAVMYEKIPSGPVRLKQLYTSTYRTYYCLYLTQALFNKVTQTKRSDIKPEEVWERPIKQLIKLIAKEKPDVVFLNGFGHFNWMLLKAAEAAGVPVVIQHAGILTKELALHKERYTEVGRHFLNEMEKDSTRISAVEIFLNSWSRDYYWKHVARGKPRNTEVVPLPFDFSIFHQLGQGKNSSKQPPFNKKFFHVGMIGRWDKIKNHEAVLALAKAAREQKLPWRFHSVVEIPSTKEIKAIKKEYEQYIDVLPPMDKGDIARFCRSVDLIIMPSLFDVSPTVVLEAIALNTPVVISPNVGYVHDFVAHGAARWVIDFSNPHKALKNILKISGKKMPSALKKHLRTIHKHDRVFSAYLDIFKEARLRTMPMSEVFRVLLRQEVGKYIPERKPKK